MSAMQWSADRRLRLLAGGHRPKAVGGTFAAERPEHSASGRSPIMARNRSHATAEVADLVTMRHGVATLAVKVERVVAMQLG